MPLFWNKFIWLNLQNLCSPDGLSGQNSPVISSRNQPFVGNDVTVDSKSLLFYQPVGGDIEVKVLWNTTPDCVKCFDD